MSNVYDYAIVGAGCAGLSLAVELFARTPADKRILLIDPRREYLMDRIWCFWNTIPHRFSALVQHEWPRWRVRHGGKEVVRMSAQYPYQYLPAGAFYASVLREIDKFQSADLRLGTRAFSMTEGRDSVHIETDQGDFEASMVFDGRNDPRHFTARGHFLQHYIGQRVKSDQPVFDPETVTLMDFDIPQNYGIAFAYLLPFSETEAIVEPTLFSHVPVEREIYHEMIRSYLRERFELENYSVEFEEQGVIPMTTAIGAPHRAGRIVPIGTRAGVVKASTGYGFLAIQRWSQIVARAATTEGKVQLPAQRPAFVNFLDRVFLAFIETHPESAPGLFFNLFRSVSAEGLVRFLSDRATVPDLAAVINSMPKAPFIRQALKVMGK